MMDYYDVSGCYILRPWSFKVWKCIQSTRRCATAPPFTPPPPRRLSHGALRRVRRGRGLLPAVHFEQRAAAREGPRGGLCAGGGVGDAQRADGPAGAAGHPPHVRDGHVPGVCAVDPEPPGHAAAREPVVQRRALGVQAPAAVPAVARVPVAGGPLGLPQQDRGGRGGAGDPGVLPGGVRGAAGGAGHQGHQEREGKVCGRAVHDHVRGVHPGRGARHPGLHVALPGAELCAHVPHQHRGPRRAARVGLAELVGLHHALPRRHDHGARGRPGDGAAAARGRHPGGGGAGGADGAHRARGAGRHPGALHGAGGRAARRRGRRTAVTAGGRRAAGCGRGPAQPPAAGMQLRCCRCGKRYCIH